MTVSLDAALAGFSPDLPLAVGYSGGADSTALLLACSRKWPGQVVAIHVHHGLQIAADGFEVHCRSFCAALQVPIIVKRVDARNLPGQSPEDAARRARYGAFGEVVRERELGLEIRSVALGQHADDQVETLLLALSRGGGLPGLSAMPAQWVRDGLTFHRPLLRVSGPDVRDWLRACGVDFVEDPSNRDERFARNRIRAQLMPALRSVFPQFRDTFSRSATHVAQAQSILLDVAREDLMRLGVPPRIDALQALNQARQANALRHWLGTEYRVTPSTAQLDELMHQVGACMTRGHQIRIKVGSGVVERRGNALHWYNPAGFASRI